jgi:ABC-2 type transport system permease protein
MSAGSTTIAVHGARRTRLVQQLHILRVIAGTEYKLKYAESVLGYVWSIAKPLAMFAVLYTVFSRFFKLNVGFADYSLYLLIGIVLWTFFVDGTSVAMTSLVARSPLLRKLAFPHIVIPLSLTMSAAMTFLVNLVVVGVFVAVNHISPQADWLLLPFLLIELIVFTFAVGLVLATMFVRLRDVGQVWDLAVQLLFFASPIIYPVGFMPPWAKPIAFVSPVVQVMQDVRAVIIGGPQAITVSDIYGTGWAYLVPLGFCVLTLVFALWLFHRESPWFAERI